MSSGGPEILRLEAERVSPLNIKYNPYLCLADCESANFVEKRNQESRDN